MTQVKPAGPDYFTWEPSHPVDSAVVPLFASVMTDPDSVMPTSPSPHKKAKAKHQKGKERTKRSSLSDAQ